MSSDPSAKGPHRNIRIGRYEVLSHVATGGMGAVYKARDVENNREVALKVLSPEMAAKPAMLERFRREARHAAKLRHENVVTLYEFGEANHTHFLAMEFVDGIDLHEYSGRKGPLDPDEALDILMQACRGIDHAYQQGLIHRDIKPSNFLVTRQGERRIVKMTDLGLARQADNEEFRVTRAGTTVGTLDYMAPEQARDSGLADIRSDLYSLGSTWYHLLAGHPPFPKGGLGERLHRIMHEDPPDIRQANPAVSDDMASVLHRLLAKRPAKRYQTPAKLLRDLEALANGKPIRAPRKSLEKTEPRAAAPDTAGSEKTRTSARGRKTPSSLPSRSRADTEIDRSITAAPTSAAIPTMRRYVWYGVVASLVPIVAISFVLAYWLRRYSSSEEVPQQTVITPGLPNPLTPVVPSSPKSTTQRKPDSPPLHDQRTPDPITPKKPTWPALSRPSKAIDYGSMQKEIEAPWAKTNTPASTVELTVGRLSAGYPGKHFASLSAACQAIPAGTTGIIELRDNGPFFDLPAKLADRSLVLRAGKGYQPLLIWDVQRMLDQRRRNRERRESMEDTAAPIFLEVKRGNVTLQDLHVVLKWPNAPSEGAAVLRVEDGDVNLSGCTFSTAGKPRNGVSLLRLEGTRAEAARCRLRRCYLRGDHLTMLELKAPGARTLIEDSLLVGGEASLIEIHAGSDRPTEISTVRSTIVCGKNAIHLQRAPGNERDPAFHWLGWDVLIARNGTEAGGEMLRISDGANTSKASWRAVNCLYAGWETLLAATNPIPAADISGWQRRWGRAEGDATLADSWPTAVLPDVSELPAKRYRTADSPTAFAASTDAETLLGCRLDRLPAVNENWKSLTFERFTVQTPAAPDNAAPPEIPVAPDQLYHGEKLNLDLIDLGAYLQNIQRRYRLAPQVVLHLSGSGERLSSPIRLKNCHLTLFFEPASEKTEPLTLAPSGRGSAESLVEIEQGNLSIINGRMRFSQADEARVLPWLIKMHGGDLRLFRCHLEVPPRESGPVFRGLISLDGSGDSATEQVHSLAANETVLLSASDGLFVQGIGARVQLTQTLLIAGNNAVRLALDPDSRKAAANSPARSFTGKANVQCVFDHATVAARGAVLYLPDVKYAEPPTEPVILQTHDCGFVNLFNGRTSRPGLVRYEGEALAHGLLVWQSENDSYDRRIWFGALASTAALPDKPEDHASWVGLWGSPNLYRAQLDLLVFRTLDGDRWMLERLLGWKAPGVNLEALGLARKLPAKAPR